jgi:L-iditol 2-dehydrogenase
MLTAELVARHELCLTEKEIADPGPGEVQVRVEAVGICGSDVHWYAEGGIGDTPNEYPMVLGHEPAGTVVKAGAGVTGWSPGDRVVLEPALYCHECRFCRTGHANVCEKIRFMSNPGVPGFFRECVNLPAHNLLPAPAGLGLDIATMAEPLAITMHSMALAQITAGESAVVIGAGPIGLLTIACLKLAGAGPIIAVEPLPHRREMARMMGADETVDVEAGDRLSNIDCVLDCAAKEDTINQAFRVVRNAGRVLLTGIHSAPLVPFDVSNMRRKELVLYNVRRSNGETAEAIELLKEHTAWFAPLVTHHVPLDRIGDASQIAEHYAEGVGKLVITPPAGTGR